MNQSAAIESECEYDIIVISDLHLGMKRCLNKELFKFLKTYNAKEWIINGDFIDGYAVNAGRKWKKKYTKIFNLLAKKSEKSKIWWVIGNHDIYFNKYLDKKFEHKQLTNDMLDEFANNSKNRTIIDQLANFKASKIRICREMIISLEDKKYFVIHGDVFDVNCPVWLYKLGSWAYDFALWLNDIYNWWLKFRKRPPYSLSQYLKGKVKSVAKWLSSFEEELVALAQAHQADGVICGHIHNAKITTLGDIKYLNSGDWVESGTALGYKNGKWELIYA